MEQLSNVDGVYRVMPAQARGEAKTPAPGRNGFGRVDDRVEISDVGSMLARMDELPDLRIERIARIRAEISNGTFETPERLEGTVDRLLEEL
ncbi:MAG: flagellar biosynthesis anti-sigma factor FlgM [bacterium]|nr:flagellar biosynthesis anti-sigma factor FlgM [bacterium]